MGAHRLKRDDAQITEAWRNAGSLRQFCVALGMSYKDDISELRDLFSKDDTTDKQGLRDATS